MLLPMQALASLKSGDEERSAAPEGWLFEAEGADTDLPPDIEALLEQQAQQQVESSSNSGLQEKSEGEDPLTYGQEYTPDQLEGLPKVGLLSIVPVPGLMVSIRRRCMGNTEGSAQLLLCPSHAVCAWDDHPRDAAATGKSHVAMLLPWVRRRSCRAG